MGLTETTYNDSEKEDMTAFIEIKKFYGKKRQKKQNYHLVRCIKIAPNSSKL